MEFSKIKKHDGRVTAYSVPVNGHAVEAVTIGECVEMGYIGGLMKEERRYYCTHSEYFLRGTSEYKALKASDPDKAETLRYAEFATMDEAERAVEEVLRSL